jgi:hypothetical protein
MGPNCGHESLALFSQDIHRSALSRSSDSK